MSPRRVLVTVILFILCATGITVAAFWPFSEKKPQERHRTRVIVPTASGDSDMDAALIDYLLYEDRYSLKAPLAEGELALSVLNFDFENSAIEEQIVVFHSLTDNAHPLSITFFGYDEQTLSYRRLWDAPVAATMPGTVALYTQDLLGDRSFCIIITGMNERGEHTMTVFRKDPQEDRARPFAKIAEIRIGGSITVQESERSLAYQQGIARAQPFAITAWERDGESDNMMDRIEITYTYSPARGTYEQSAITRIPGSQIEERRVRAILAGEPKVFEEFIFDLWYHVNPQGTIDKSQYVYFDPVKREIIFFGDGTQQVFNWQHSTSTRYGLYISSQNISVTTLRRFLDIEMESLDGIRLRIIEDIRLKINISAPWDGSYRRAGGAALRGGSTEDAPIHPYADAVYDSSLGRLHFHAAGEYELSALGTITRGRYAFFRVGGDELLELRPERHSGTRLIYRVTSMENADTISLSRVRLGTAGVYDLHEAPVILTRAQ